MRERRRRRRLERSRPSKKRGGYSLYSSLLLYRRRGRSPIGLATIAFLILLEMVPVRFAVGTNSASHVVRASTTSARAIGHRSVSHHHLHAQHLGRSRHRHSNSTHRSPSSPHRTFAKPNTATTTTPTTRTTTTTTTSVPVARIKMCSEGAEYLCARPSALRTIPRENLVLHPSDYRFPCRHVVNRVNGSRRLSKRPMVTVADKAISNLSLLLGPPAALLSEAGAEVDPLTKVARITSRRPSVLVPECRIMCMGASCACSLDAVTAVLCRIGGEREGGEEEAAMFAVGRGAER